MHWLSTGKIWHEYPWSEKNGPVGDSQLVCKDYVTMYVVAWFINIFMKREPFFTISGDWRIRYDNYVRFSKDSFVTCSIEWNTIKQDDDILH